MCLRHRSHTDLLFAKPLELVRMHCLPYAVQQSYTQMELSVYYLSEFIHVPRAAEMQVSAKPFKLPLQCRCSSERLNQDKDLSAGDEESRNIPADKAERVAAVSEVCDVCIVQRHQHTDAVTRASSMSLSTIRFTSLCGTSFN